MIPSNIKIKNKKLPENPGVYFYFDDKDQILYIGKATSLKDRVGSYFVGAHDNRITELVSKIAKINFIETPTVIEALVLEANKIKEFKPPYNILMRDDKSYLYLTISNEDFPRPVLMRGHELEKLGINPFDRELSKKAQKKFLAVFGPYTSGGSLKKALEFVRKIIPWSTCEPPAQDNPPQSPLKKGGRRVRPCFYYHIKKCPGVCTGEISKTEYRKIIKKLIMFFDGKKIALIGQLERDMKRASGSREYEQAAKIRNQIHALNHIQDIAFITKEDVELPVSKKDPESTIDLHGRIEAYDISNIGGSSAVGSMVVFQEGGPAKDKYRNFKIKTVVGANDVAMLEEVMRRRLKRAETYSNAWPLPEVMVIDGGKPQVNRIQKVLDEFGVQVPIVGLAKGFDRKQDVLIFDRSDLELAKVVVMGKEVFQRARDEAHRFAVKYHRQVRSKASGTRRKSNIKSKSKLKFKSK